MDRHARGRGKEEVLGGGGSMGGAALGGAAVGATTASRWPKIGMSAFQLLWAQKVQTNVVPAMKYPGHGENSRQKRWCRMVYTCF